MPPKFEPAWSSTMPDFLLIQRATWATPKLRAEAAAEIVRRNAEPARINGHKPLIELSARPERHREMLEAALVADQEERDAA